MTQMLKKATPNSVQLDTETGFREYVTAMQTILHKITAISQPGDPDPRQTANLMITEVSRFFSELLPEIDIRETATFFGAVLGTEIGGWVADSSLKEEEARDAIVAIIYAACAETIPRVVKMLREAKKKSLL